MTEEITDPDLEETTEEVDETPIAGLGTLVFGKWDASEVTCEDPGISPYINLQTVGTPHSGGRHANAWMGKSKLSVVERFINGEDRRAFSPLYLSHLTFTVYLFSPALSG